MPYRYIVYILLALNLFSGCHNDTGKRRKIKLTDNAGQTLSAIEKNQPVTLKFDAEEKLDIAILTFENKTADTSLSWLCQGITDMLIRDLSQSRYLKVVSMQRIYDILKKYGIESPCALDYHLLSKIGKETGVKSIVLGNFSNIHDSLLIQVQLYNTQSGRLIKEQRVAGLGLAQIFGMVDNLSKKIRNNLRLTLKGIVEPDFKITEISTNSLAAYKSFTEGVDLAYKAYFGDAIGKFEEAIAIDSTFAMAQYWAGIIYTKLAQSNKADIAIAKALKYSHNTTAKEKMKIEWLYAANKGEYQRAFELLQQIIREYPDDKLARYRLAGYYYIRKDLKQAQQQLYIVMELDPGYTQAFILQSAIYKDQGRYKEAIQALQNCIKLKPDDASLYHNLGEIFELTGETDKAKAYYEKAVSLKPDFHFSILNLAHIYSTTGDYDKAREKYLSALDVIPTEELKAEVYSGLSQIDISMGKYSRALQHIKKAFQLQTSNTGKASYLTMAAGIYFRKGYFDSTITFASKALSWQEPNIPAYSIKGQAYLELGNIDSAKFLADKIDQFIVESRLELYRNIHLRLLARISAAQKNYKKAIGYCSSILDNNKEAFSIYLDLGKFYYENNEPSKAIDSYNIYINKYSHNAIVLYYLALAYETEGNRQKAMELMNKFLDKWKYADQNIPEVIKAKTFAVTWEKNL